MRRNRRNWMYLIIVMAILGGALGFAFLNTSLTINGVSDVSGASWDIYWDNIQAGSHNVTDITTPATISQGNTEVVFNVNFASPGDTYEFTVDAVNNGSINAMIDTVTNGVYAANGTTPKALPDYLEYTVTYNDGVAVAPHQLLSANSTVTYHVKVHYKESTTASQLPSTDDNYMFKLAVTYVQADNNAQNIGNATITCHDKIYDGTEQTACSCMGGTIGGDFKATNTGTYTATCTGDANHNNATSVSWTMTKEDAVITCSNKIYDGTEQTACSCNGGTIGGDYKAINTGSYTATCTGDALHNDAESKTWTMTKGDAVLSCSNKTYDGTEQTACTCTGGTIGGDYKATNAGEYTASCVGDSNHNSPANETWTMNKGEVPVSDLSISNTGVVSWTNNSNASSYQISIDNSNWTSVPPGTTTTSYNYLNTIVANTGSRTVYVKAVASNQTNYNDTTTNISKDVYTVTFNRNNNDYGTVSPATINAITGETYSSSGNVITLQDGRSVTATPATVSGYNIAFDSWSSESGTITSATTITANFTSEISNYNITYDANDGEFGDTTTTNNVEYSVTAGTVTKYSHTSNVDDTGLKTTNYGNNWNNSNITGTERGDISKAHVVSIPGASTLNIEMYYNGQNSSYDWASIWAGSYPSYTAYSNYNSIGKVTTAMGGLSANKYGGSQSGSYTVNGNSLTSMGKSTINISGDSVTFSYYSNASSYGQGYGYYAIISGTGKIVTTDTGTYEEPSQANKVFTGWNTERDGNGISITYESELSKLTSANTTLYAQYREPTATFTTGQLFNAAIKQASGTSSATYSTTNSNITSFEKYTGTVTQQLLNDATIVSDANSENDIYAWFDNGTIYWYTTSDIVYFNSDSSYMFNYLTNLTEVDLSEFDLSKVSSSSSIFGNMTNFDTLITPKVNASTSISIGKTLMNQSNTTYSSLTSSTPTETTLKVPYTITFDLNGGSSTTCTSTANTKQIYPANPVGTIPTISAQKFGYVQGGWCSDSACNSVINLTAETIPPSSITYYVQWTKDGVWADQIEFDDTNLGTNCNDAQCVVKYIADHFKEKRVSINGN